MAQIFKLIKISPWQKLTLKNLSCYFNREGIIRNLQANCGNMTEEGALHFWLGEFSLMYLQNVYFPSYKMKQ